MSESVIERVRNDPLYRPFHNPNFQVAQYTSSLLSASRSPDELQRVKSSLKSGIVQLENDIRKAVGERSDALLQQVVTIEEVEKRVAAVRRSSEALKSGVSTTKKLLTVPYANISRKTDQLDKMYQTCGLLRLVSSLLALCQSARMALAQQPPDWATAAVDLITLLKWDESKLMLVKRVPIAAKRLSWAIAMQEAVRKQATPLLTQGLSMARPNDVSTALRIYVALGECDAQMHDKLENSIQSLQQELRSICSTGGSSTPSRRSVSASQRATQAATSAIAAAKRVLGDTTSIDLSGSANDSGEYRAGDRRSADNSRSLSTGFGNGLSSGSSSSLQTKSGSIKSVSNSGVAESPDDARNQFWKDLGTWLDHVHTTSTEFWMLLTVAHSEQSVLKLPATPSSSFLSLYWQPLWVQIGKELYRALSAPFVKSRLVTEYSKLLNVLMNSADRTAAYVVGSARSTGSSDMFSNVIMPENSLRLSPSSGGGHAAVTASPTSLQAFMRDSVVSALGALEAMFVADAASACIPSNSTSLSPEAVSRWIRHVKLELDRCAFDRRLLGCMVDAVARAMEAVLKRIDGLMDSVLQLHTGILSLRHAAFLVEHSDRFAFVLERADQALREDIAAVIAPDWDRLKSALLQWLAVHERRYKRQYAKPNAPITATTAADRTAETEAIRNCLSIVEELRDRTLSSLPPCDAVVEARKELIYSALQWFVAVVSLIRPQDNERTMSIASDMGQWESLVSTWFPAENLKSASMLRFVTNSKSVTESWKSSPAYEEWRSFKAVMFLPLDQFMSHAANEAPAAAASIRKIRSYVVLHHIIGRSLTSSLMLPYVKAGWTVEKYVGWLETHSDVDVWRAVESCLDIYQDGVNTRGETQFDPVYPALRAMGVWMGWSASIAKK